MKRTIEIYQCDRCHREMEKPHRDSEVGTAFLSYTIDYGTAGEANTWGEMCKPCNDHVVALLRSEAAVAKMHQRSEKDRKEGLEW